MSEWLDKSQPPPADEGLPAEVTEMVLGYWAKAQRAPSVWQKLGWALWTGALMLGGMIDYLIWGDLLLPRSMEVSE